MQKHPFARFPFAKKYAMLFSVAYRGKFRKKGLICYDDEEEVFIGRDLGHTRGYSETVAARIDGEIKRIVDECYAKAKQMIMDHRDVLDACANLLLEKEKISQKEFEALFDK